MTHPLRLPPSVQQPALRALLNVALADGALNGSEVRLLTAAARAIGYDGPIIQLTQIDPSAAAAAYNVLPKNAAMR